MIPRQPYRELSLQWQGQHVALRYTPDWCRAGDSCVGHLELRCSQPLPVTETGYRSHFLQAPPADFDPEAFVRALLDVAAWAPEWQQRSDELRQGSLF